MKKVLYTLTAALFACAGFAGEVVFEEAFDSEDSVAKYGQWAKVEFDKGGKGEKGSLKMTLEKKAMSGISMSFDAKKLRGSVLEMSCEIKGDNIASDGKLYSEPKFMITAKGKSRTVYSGPVIPLGNFGWTKYKAECQVPSDATEVMLFMGFQNCSGTLRLRNAKIEDRQKNLPLEPLANVGFADETAGDNKGGWFDGGAAEDASKFNGKPNVSIPYFIISPEKNGGRAAVLLGKKPMGADSAKIGEIGRAAKYLYILNAVQSPAKGVVGSVAIASADGKKHVFNLEYGVDTACWQDVRSEIKNAALGAGWAAPKGHRRTNGLYSTRLAIPENFGEIESVEFGGAKVPWIIVAAALSDEKFKFPSESKFVVKAGRDWKPLPILQNIDVKEGSALDCSALWNIGEIKHRVVASKQGGWLELENAPGVPVAFQTVANQGTTYHEYIKTKESTEAYVKQLRIQGYNMARFHYLDFSLMSGATKPLEFNKEMLDRVDYYIYCLKKNGIYLNLDAMCSRYGFELGNTWIPDDSGRNYNFDLFFKKSARDNWYAGVKELLTHVNPYTKTRLVDDPVLAILNAKNEQEFGLLRDPHNPEDLRPAWIEFLKKRYGTVEKYNAAWKTSAASWDDVKLYKNDISWGRDARARDIALFKFGIEKDMWQWFEKSFREMGYKGLCANYDMIKSRRYTSIRKDMPMVMMHSYHDHPAYNVGGTTRFWPKSSLGNANSIFRGIAGSAIWRKPLLVTEYGHVFCDPYRYEQAFSIGAYAALQGIGALTVHAQAVGYGSQNSPIIPFFCMFDPINKAGEFLTTHMLVRGDVARSKSALRVDYSTQEEFDKVTINDAMGKGESSMSLVVRVSDLPDSDAKPDADEIAVKSGKGAATMTFEGYSVVADSKGGISADDIVAQMKARGLLDKNNRTDAAKGIFESSTGELYLDSEKHYMTVNTPRLQAMCSEAGGKCELADFAVSRMSERGCAAAVSVDGKPLAQSERIVVVFATNSLNDGMTFLDDSMDRVMNWGKPPVLNKTGRLSFKLKNANADKLKLYALSMTGERLRELNLRTSDGGVRATVDTSKLEVPSVFYEICVEGK